MFDYFTKPKLSQKQTGSSNSLNVGNDASNEGLPQFKELLEFIGIDPEKKSQLFKEIKLLTRNEKEFINNKSIELLDIDKIITDDTHFNDPANADNLYVTLKKLQFNVLSLYLSSKIKNPDCAEDIKKIISRFNSKIKNINDIVETNLNRDIPISSQSQPLDNVSPQPNSP